MEYVFREIIKKWHEIDHKEKAYNEKQITNLLYKQKIDLELIEYALEAYSSYFYRLKKYLYLPNWGKVISDFPSWFNLVGDQDQEVIKAFIDEENAIEEDNSKLWIIAKINRKISNSSFGFLYEALISLPDGTSTPGQEGIPINLWWRELTEKNNVEGVFLAYHRRLSTVILRVSNELSDAHLNTNFRFKPKPINFLRQIKQRFNSVKNDESNLTHKLFHRNDFLQLDKEPEKVADSSMNCAQNDALSRVFSQNVTFIWGPPGTGKTYTLSKIITQACCLGMRVLAVGISNVSVDVLGKEIINEFENYNETSLKLLNDRKVLRFGYPVLPEIVKDDRLYPDKEIVDSLRKEYSAVLKILRSRNNQSTENKAINRNKQVVLRNDIKKVNQKRIGDSRLVFTTAAQCFIADNFENEKFDLVVVDEVGMMPLIQTLAMSGLTKNKFVVAGDFNQLGPISAGKTEAVNNWFNSDIFQYFKDVEGVVEDVLVMLTEQRRMHPDICELINERFYKGKLTSFYSENFKEIKTLYGEISDPYCFIPVTPKDGAQVKLTKGRSRVNSKSAQIVTDLVESVLKGNKDIEIGVITPYNGQVIDIRKKLNNRILSNEDLDRVKVGTVHSFQGSGFDMIIYDIVDNCEKNIGILYKGFGGERLVNVALSRAKHKLIIVGDPKVFTISDELEEVSKKLRSLMVELRISKNQLSLNSIINVIK
ncbi:DEAD/DEAH box helicase [Mariniflexile sp. AS56]|uniref:DEAD/DEAH box helicase n=1 Tax=Mariniflexile sp. AS56 TaxID=3063957 RepID=UPI0026F0B485|nr:AAA domain-containing protein [Mariniflexile sp. AS56]MDO7173712.1 AAA domain-containing protein [Mariniflexile sp. AS56]